MKPIAEMNLWCLREGKVIPFIASVSAPVQEGEDWRCEVSLGDLLDHDINPLYQVDSLLSLVGAIHFITAFLKSRAELGDKFYLEPSVSEEITDISELFWSSKIPTVNKGLPESCN